MKRSAILVILSTIFCCAIMAVFDGIIQPGYWIKSTVKIILFLGIPLILSIFSRKLTFRELFRFQKQGIFASLGLGAGIYLLILGGYFLISNFFDFSGIVDNLSQNAGVTKSNFLLVSLYISFVNSLLEEFFFRGFVFTNLQRDTNRTFAHLFSASLFSLYHVSMMLGWFSPLLFALVLLGLVAGGLIFNLLNQRLQTIYCSWLVHMFANFAINTIGFILMV